MCLLPSQAFAAVTATILAGGEFDSPADTPSSRLDTAGWFPFVGALDISNGSSSYKGSAVAISREWIITAGHNVDLDDDGLPDALWSGNLHLPGYGVFGVFRYDFDHPSTTGQPGGQVSDYLGGQLQLKKPHRPRSPVTGAAGRRIGGVVSFAHFRQRRPDGVEAADRRQRDCAPSRGVHPRGHDDAEASPIHLRAKDEIQPCHVLAGAMDAVVGVGQVFHGGGERQIHSSRSSR